VWVSGALVASSTDLVGPFRHFRVDITAPAAAAATAGVNPCVRLRSCVLFWS
jgi:hypothetical protein